MFGTLRSLFYLAKRDIVILVTLITCLWFPLVFLIFDGGSISEITGSSYVCGISDAVIITLFGLMVIVTRISGADLSDRTVNYEIMIGHPRWKPFLSRMILSMLLGGVLPWIILYLPVGFFTLTGGFGVQGDARNILLRMGLSLFPLLRFSVFFFLVTMLLDGFGKGLVVSFLLFDGISALVSTVEEMFSFRFHSWLAYSDLSDLTVYDNAKSVVVNGRTVMKYETELASRHIYSTILCSVLVICLYAVIGYLIFKRKDRH